MALRYLTQEWAERALALVESDERIAEAVRGLQVSLLSIVLRPPEGCYGFLYVAFDDTGLRDYRVGHDYHTIARGIDPTFVVSGPYDVFAQVQRGELSERRAILKGQLHLTGSFVKALRFLNALETISEVLRTIECET